jgi:hypothetical protein
MQSGSKDSAYGAVDYQRKNLTVRGLGLAMILGSAACGKFLVLDKLEEFRKTHEVAIHYSHKLIMLAPILLMLGLAFLIGGASANDFFKNRQKWGFKQYALLIILILPAFAFQFWFDSELAKIGYQEMH